MKTALRKMGNSLGVLIPKPFLIEVGLDMGEVDIQVEDDAIVIRKIPKAVRAGWSDAAKKLAISGDDALAWPEFPNEDDKEFVW